MTDTVRQSSYTCSIHSPWTSGLVSHSSGGRRRRLRTVSWIVCGAVLASVLAADGRIQSVFVAFVSGVAAPVLLQRILEPFVDQMLAGQAASAEDGRASQGADNA